MNKQTVNEAIVEKYVHSKLDFQLWEQFSVFLHVRKSVNVITSFNNLYAIKVG